MTRTPVNDWAELAAEWQSGLADPPALEQLARRERAHRRRLAVVVVLEVLVTAAAMAGSVALVRGRGDVVAWTAAVAAWVTLVAVLAFAVWNRRGTWRPLARTVEGYLAVSELRCRRKIRTARFVAGFVLAGTAALTGWRVLRLGGFAMADGPEAWWRLALPAVVVLAYLAWAVWYARRARRELAWLEGLRAALTMPGL